MKKRVIGLGIVVLLIVFGFVWWNSSTVFLESVDPGSISAIQVRNGHTGNRFDIRSEADISYVVEQMQGLRFHKSGISLFRLGTWLTLTFTDEDGDTVCEFIINGSEVIRDDPFFYEPDQGDLQNIIDCVTALEMESE